MNLLLSSENKTGTIRRELTRVGLLVESADITRVSSSFIGCPIYIALCHICSLTKTTSWKFCQWSGTPGFNLRSSHTKDSENGT